ncbi:MAG: hypothetical protein M3121_03460 [Chloroflexota bacterium]|nr:hypothetical protein [Chloroflexota bacterium]
MNESVATPTAPPAASTTPLNVRPLPATVVASRRLIHIGPFSLAVTLWVAVAVMVYALLMTPVAEGNRGLMNLTESVGALERVALWQRAFSWLPGLNPSEGSIGWPPFVLNWTVRLCLVVLFALHAAAFWRCWSGGAEGALWRWLIGPIGAHLLMLGFVPSNADVFYYAISGDLANSGANPYAYPLVYFPGNPLYPYNHWVDMTAVYGPIWTALNQAIVAVSGPDPVAAVISFKLFLGASAIALALFVAWFAGRLTGSRRLGLAAGVFVVWQPNLILESSGQAHNDAVMLLLATAGMALAVLGGISGLRGGLILLAASVAIKYVTLPLLGLLALARLADVRRTGVAGLARAWALDGLAVSAVWIAAFAPYWVGPRTFAEMVTEPGRNFSNPVWLLPYLIARWSIGDVVDPIFFGGLRALMLVGTLALVSWLLLRFGRRMLDGRRRSWMPRTGSRPSDLPWWTGPLLCSWTAIMAALAFLPVNVHAWYWTWPVVPIALLVAIRAAGSTLDGVDLALPRWFWGYLLFSAAMTLVYHTRVVHI